MTEAAPPANATADREAWQQRQLQSFGHPRGLLVLAATEFWDRVSFHGMQALA